MREVRIKLVSCSPAVDYKVEKPQDAVAIMKMIIGDMANEYFAGVLLNTHNKPMDFIIAGIGTTTGASFQPGSIIQAALLSNSPKVMLFHNHPSGEIEPSSSDLSTTQKFILAGKLNGIEVLDHVIVSGDRYYSFAENGLIQISDEDYFKGLKELKNMSSWEFNEKYAFQVYESYKESGESYEIVQE